MKDASRKNLSKGLSVLIMEAGIPRISESAEGRKFSEIDLPINKGKTKRIYFR